MGGKILGYNNYHYGRLFFVEIYVTPMDGSLVIMDGSMLSIFFFTPKDGSLVIMEGSLLSIFLLRHWMVELSLWKVVCRCDFWYSNGW